LGTSLTDQHAKLIHRYTESVVILYDSDPAGEKAAQRASEIFRAEKLSVQIALMPKGEDPDTLLRQAGPAAVKLATEKGIGPIDYLLLQIGQRHSPEDDAYWNEAIDALSMAKSDMELRSYAQRLSPLVPELKDRREAAEWIRKQALNRRKQKKEEAEGEPTGRGGVIRPKLGLKRVEADLFRAFLDETFRSLVFGAVTDEDLFITATGSSLARAIGDGFPLTPPKGPLVAWSSDLEDEAMRQLLIDLEMTTSDPFSREYVEESIAVLQRKREEREGERIKHEVEGDERLKKIQDLLSRRHIDS
jgi:DNA primase